MLSPEQIQQADQLKAQLIADGSLVDQGGEYVFTRDVRFPSVEIATYILTGENPLDAASMWIDDRGRSLRQISSERN